ncbi:hypothetical protein NQ318_004756 [Aromia moschata]|uniref:Uncharacterized protein n=1 Tax=Aromia moschata TaxID=1265417 RepID=A0AAV8XW19_9CUCU|nr:hypothetical protein NQ318_004756 [Aromia moschata]
MVAGPIVSNPTSVMLHLEYTMKFLIVITSVVLAASALSDRDQWQDFKLKPVTSRGVILR